MDKTELTLHKENKFEASKDTKKIAMRFLRSIGKQKIRLIVVLIFRCHIQCNEHYGAAVQRNCCRCYLESDQGTAGKR